MFAVLSLERDPLSLAGVPAGLAAWVQVVGTVAAIILLFWLPVRLVRGGGPPSRPWMPLVFNCLLGGTLLGYLALLGIHLPDIMAALSGGDFDPASEEVKTRIARGKIALTFGAGCALLIVCLPFFVNLGALRWRRIWAVGRLSFKEAVRRRVLYVFCVLIVVLLFLNWFVQTKPETQLQSYVEIVYRTTTPLLLLSAALLAAFAIPTDIKQQTIHTVVTKPLERFEMVLGRILGYTMLITLLLFVMTTISLFYVLRGANPAAAEESLKARVPVYGTLDFWRIDAEGTDRETRETSAKPENVGREWDFRKHIPGQAEDRPKDPFLYGVWSFTDLPAALGKRDTVRCEFAFDIYRLNKGQENRGVLCSFFFETRNFDKSRANRQKYQAERRAKGAGAEMTPEIDNEVSEKFGYFEVQGKTIADYHTMTLELPAGLIRNALQPPADKAQADEPLLRVRVRCGSPGQMVGMARYDLYFRGDDPQGGGDTLAFVLNYYKGALGLWMILVLVISLCVFISTELGGVITFLCVILLYLGGTNRDFIQEIIKKETAGGGPVESAMRLFNRAALAALLEETTLAKVASGSDEAFRWLMMGMLQVLPDTERFGYADRVANGFNVSLIKQDLLPTFLLLLGYLFPWALLSYYMIRSREIAGAH